jgi:hypothetical protein
VLTIQRANPLDCADSLKSLFAANEHPALAALVDTAYSEVARTGGASWIGVDDAGQVQLNVTFFRHDFAFRGKTVRAGVLGHTVTAKQYRWFFPSVVLVRRLLKDVSEEAEVDFLYTDPQPAAAVVSKKAGLEEIGALDRFVIPLTDRSTMRALAARIYAMGIRVRAGLAPASCTTIDSTKFDVGRFDVPIGISSSLRPHHSDSLYRRRLRAYPGPDYVWCEFRLAGHRRVEPPDAAVLLQGPDDNHVIHVCAIRRAPAVALSSLVPGLVRTARARGAHRLQVETIRESDLASELVATGFRRRGDLLPVFGKAITPAGDEVVSAMHQWDITTFDMER